MTEYDIDACGRIIGRVPDAAEAGEPVGDSVRRRCGPCHCVAYRASVTL